MDQQKTSKEFNKKLKWNRNAPKGKTASRQTFYFTSQYICLLSYFTSQFPKLQQVKKHGCSKFMVITLKN